MTMHDPLAVALDRFGAPPLRAGFADRVVNAATALPSDVSRRPPRDRRGLWRRSRQVLLGTAAVGLLSAGAVASGLLGKVGIEVPVLTAMLAPKPAPKAKPQVVPKKPASKPVELAAPSPAPPIAVPLPGPEEQLRLRTERRERLAAFAAEHPRVAQAVVRRVGQQLRARDAERRTMLGLPPADPNAPDWRPLTPEERFILRRERMRDLRRVEIMLDRWLAAREAALAAQAANQASLAPTNMAEAAPQAAK